MHKYTKHIAVVAGLASAFLSLSSCAPFPSSHPLSSGGSSSSKKTIDPRFVGTWAGHNRGDTTVMTLSPNGRGKAYVQSRGRTYEQFITWSTRESILKIERHVWFGDTARGMGYSLFRSNLSISSVRLGGGYPHRSYGNRKPDVSEMNFDVTSFRKRKFIARDVAKPSRVYSFYKYSDQPTYDPILVYSWMQRGGYKAIDKQQ